MIWLLLPPCLLLAFMLSGIESALHHVSRVRVRHAAEEGDRQAARLSPLLDCRAGLIHATKVLNHMVSLTAFLLCTHALVHRFGDWGWAPALLVVLPVFLVGLKFVPKHLFRRYPFRALRRLSAPLALLRVLAGPWQWLCRFMRKAATDGSHPDADRPGLQSLADTVTRLGVLPAPVCALVQQLASFQKQCAADLAMPLDQLTALPLDLPLAGALAVNGTTQHPWHAVLGPDGTLLGWLDMTALPAKPQSDRLVRQFMRPLLELAASDSALRCLQALRKRNEPVASVVDSRGGIVGLVTQQALLKALFA